MSSDPPPLPLSPLLPPSLPLQLIEKITSDPNMKLPDQFQQGTGEGREGGREGGRERGRERGRD